MSENTDSHLEEPSMTGRIDGLRLPVTDAVIRKTHTRFDAICSIKSIDELKAEIQKYFPENRHKVIRIFFETHPVCWHDLKRKLYAITTFDEKRNIWNIDEDRIWEIYSIFLIRERKQDIGDKIRVLLPDIISENRAFLEYCAKKPSLIDAAITIQPSLLDEGGYIFSQISAEKSKWYITKLITSGMIQNIDNYSYQDLKKGIPDILSRLLIYLKEIFGKDIFIPLDQMASFDWIINTLDKMIRSPQWVIRENAFRVIQSFHAWSSLGEIEKYHQLAEEKIKHLPDRFKKAGITIDWDIETNEHNDAKIYSAQISFRGKEYKMEWRVKTVRSILQKMWETEEYTNKDAIRDMIGVSFIFPDETPVEEKKHLMIETGRLMPNFWYILRDKWGLWTEIIEVEKWLRKIRKNPALVSFKVWDTSHPDFNNSSISGFLSLDGESIWTEFQYLEQSAAKWKKEDDKKYKPKGMINVLMRWPKFSTPKDCYDLLYERVNTDVDGLVNTDRLQELWYASINDMIIDYIEEGFLIPYVSDTGTELLLTCKGKEEAFIKIFPTMQKCWTDHDKYLDMKKYILGLY